MEPDETTGEVLAPDAAEHDQTEESNAEEVSQGEEAEPQESEESTPGGDSEPRYTVTIDGEERTLTRAEIEKGILLHKGFTQKSQVLAEERRQWKAQQEAYARTLEPLKGWLEFYAANQPKEPDWQAIAAKNPAEWVKQKAAWDAQEGQRRQAEAIYQQMRQAESQRADMQFVSEMQSAFPEWAADDAAADKGLSDAWNAAGLYGYTKEDVLGLRDPRVFRVLLDAAAYRKMQAGKPAVAAKVAEVIKKTPSKAPPAKAGLDEDLRKAEKRARTMTGQDRMEAAAEVMRLRQQKAMQNGSAN